MSTFSRVAVTRDGILIDGRPLFLLAGQLHYFRWPRSEWRSLLVQARAAGLNTIDTVIPWNLHEPAEGQFDFEDYADLPAYLDLIHELGLYAIVRPAPYICAEWENGGFPAWLTARLAVHDSSGRSVRSLPEGPTGPASAHANGLPLRTTDPVFVEPTLRWFDRLLPLLAERQIDRGGPIILVQIENEHWASGVYGHDAYQEQQAVAMQARGVTVPFYTCMGAGRPWPEFRNGWSGIAQKLAQTRAAWPDNPMIVSELWSGWFDDWGSNRHNGKPAASLDWQLHELLAVGAAGYSHWMWAGGTNFAHWGGRTVGGDTIHMTASYDYGAPVDEYGQPTEKFYVARRHHLLASALGAQLSRLLADAAPGGAIVISPKPVPGRAGGGSQPLRIAKNGDFVAVFLQNPSLDRQSNQVFFSAWDGLPPVHLTVEVEGGAIKPLFANLPLGERGLLLRSHSLRLLGYWEQPAGDELVCFGFEGEVAQVELALPAGCAWTLLDDGARVAIDGRRLVVRGWISQRPTVVRVAIAGRPLVVRLLTEAQAERWDPAVERLSAGSAIPASPISPTCPPLPLDNWQWLDLHERTAEEGWQPIAAPQPLELLGCPLGYGWYRAQFDLAEPTETTLAAPWLADRATVFVDGERIGVLGVDPGGARATVPVVLAAGRHDIRLLADNLGRFNYGSNTGERKGLLDTLYWGGVQEDISGGWTALWQEAVFAGEALANARPAHVRPDAEDVHLGHFAWSGPSVWLLREIHVPAGRRAVLTMTGDRNPGALFVNGVAVTRFSRHYGGGYIKEDITALLRPGVNVLALNIHDYAGAPWTASLLTYDPTLALDAVWSFRPGVTPTISTTARPNGQRQPGFWRCRFPFDPAEHGAGPFKLAMGSRHKGQIWLNGRNVCRYWQVGPQEFYKLPASWLKMENELLVLEEG